MLFYLKHTTQPAIVQVYSCNSWQKSLIPNPSPMYRSILPADVSPMQLQALIQGVVAPRPIAFASTVDADGNVNLSPFSFFNVFSSNPPILIFSPARRVRDNTTKHTLENAIAHPEVVIHIVDFNMVQQMSLSSTEYERGVNEFIKSGLTQIPSQKVKPPRVAEAPAAFECRVNQVVPLGTEGGAGNLIICEILVAHFKEHLFTEKGTIDPYRLDAVARMGGDWYCRANGDALFEVEKPLAKKGMGVDALPAAIRQSEYLSGNDLGKLGNTESMPDAAAVTAFASHPDLLRLRERGIYSEVRLHQLAHSFLESGDTDSAWKTLLQPTAE